MADWKSSMSRFAQTAVSKSKEMAETTRVNVEISNVQQKIREVQMNLGRHVLENPALMPAPDETAADLIRQAQEANEKLTALQQTLLDLRNVNICPNCGAEVSRTSKFCGKCGAPMERKVLEDTPTPVCPHCGAPIEEGATFCGNCGEKL